MANRKISAFPLIVAADVVGADDTIPVLDASAADATKNKRITVDELATAVGVDAAQADATQALADAAAAQADATEALNTVHVPGNGTVTPAKIADSTWPRCRLTKSGNQTITPSGAANTVTWDVETYDTDNMHDNVTNNSRITINTAGTYLVQVYTHWASNTTGIRLVAIRKNGAAKREAWNGIPTVSDGLGRCMTTWVGRLEVNDYIEIEVIQNGAGSLNLTGTDATQGDTYVAVEMLP